MLEAQGAVNKDKKAEKVKNAVGKLDFDRQVEILAETGGEGDLGEAAKALVGAKKSELLNKKVLTSSDVNKLQLLFPGDARVGQAQAGLVNGTVNNPFYESPALPGSTPPGPGPGPTTPTPPGRGPTPIPTRAPTGPTHRTPPASPPAPGPTPPTTPPAPRGRPGPYSDKRLKSNISYLQTLPNGTKLYQFKYVCSSTK